MTATGPGQDVGVEALDAFFARTPRLAVAFSGGCDSSFLLVAALRAGCDVKAYGVRTAFQPAFEIDDAKRLAAELGADFELVDADVLAQGEICANGPDRCYRCKTFIFSTILARMAEDGFEVLADGTNVTDDPRPPLGARRAGRGVAAAPRGHGERRRARRVARARPVHGRQAQLLVHRRARGRGTSRHRPDACRDGRTPGRDGWEAPVSATRRLTIRRRLQPRWSSVLQ